MWVSADLKDLFFGLGTTTTRLEFGEDDVLAGKSPEVLLKTSSASNILQIFPPPPEMKETCDMIQHVLKKC